MSYLSVDNLIGVQPTTTSSTFLQANVVDIYNGTTNYTHITSASTAAPNNLIIPDANGYFVATTGNQTIQSKMNHAQHGSETDPSYSFMGSLTTGFFRDGSTTIGITCGGTKRMSISDTDIIAVLPITATIFKATSGTFPTCAFTNGTNDQTGLYFGTTTTCAIACNGSTKMTFGTSATTSFQQIVNPDGSAATPSLAFSSNLNLGLFNSAGRLAISTAGVANYTFATDAMRSNLPFYSPSGSVSAPVYTWTAETNSGWFRNASNDFRYSVAGANSLGVQSNGIFLYGSTAGNNALYSASKLGYYEEHSVNATFTFDTRTANSTIYLTRIGRTVIMTITNMTFTAPATAANFFNCVGIVPVRFRPITNNAETVGSSWVLEGGTTVIFWNVIVNTLGSITYQRGSNTALSVQSNNTTFHWTIY